MPDKDTHYIECDCHDLDHTSRIWYDDEFDTFELSYKLIRFPGEEDLNNPTYMSSPSDSIFLKVFKYLRNKLRYFRLYLKCIWWAIKGRPIWFESYASFNNEETVELMKFMVSKLKLNNDQIVDLTRFINRKIDLPKVSKMDYIGEGND